MNQSLANDLIFHKKWRNQNKTAFNDNYHFDLNLVLRRNNGNYIPKSSLVNSFSRILRKCGLPALPIHLTRHTHAVLLLGADIKYVQKRLEHASIQITSNVYPHISKKIEKDRMSKHREYMKNMMD
ncbi:tyrosine-type recombinase/integrase [Bacillus sp. JZ8]